MRRTLPLAIIVALGCSNPIASQLQESAKVQQASASGTFTTSCTGFICTFTAIDPTALSSIWTVSAEYDCAVKQGTVHCYTEVYGQQSINLTYTFPAQKNTLVSLNTTFAGDTVPRIEYHLVKCNSQVCR